MRLRLSPYQKMVQLSALILITAYLSGCGGTPRQKETSTSVPPDGPTRTDPGTAQLPPSLFGEQFTSAEQQLSRFDWMAAYTTLATIDQEQTSATDRQYLDYLQARILYLGGRQDEASRLLQERTEGVLPIDSVILSKIDNFQRHMLSLSGNALASAKLGDQMLERKAAGADASPALLRSIWSDLQSVSGQELQEAQASARNQRWRGWLALSALCAASENTQNLQQGLIQWQGQYPQHPGASMLPGGLNYLLNQPANLDKVVLMLPLSGRLAPAAKAVRDGYLSNYYANRAPGSHPTDLQIVDLDRYSSVVQAYTEAVAGGANLVIGPLEKYDVAALGSLANRQVPILALNQLEEALPVGNMALIQLSLAPEDEARQIAELAFGQGARRAVVIRPAGSWGTKMEQALLARWRELGGQLGAVASYSGQEDYSSSMASALNLPASEQRARELRRMLATEVEFSARRREDLDVVFLLSRTGAQARSLKPLLAYHYARDLPVYATSSIYRGSADPRDKDLNGVRLVETPWLLGKNSKLQAAVSRRGSTGGNYTRLVALGADAYLLQTRFNQLQAGPDVRIRGNTGLLSLDPQLRIERRLQSATFDGGVLQPR